jgi:energy-coupling factor transport system permease protein
MTNLRGPRSARALWGATPWAAPGVRVTGVNRREGQASWLTALGPLTVAGQRRSCTDFPCRSGADRTLYSLSSAIPRLHAVTWLAWALAAAVIVQLAPSPLYVTLVLATSALVASAHRVSSTGAFVLLVAAGATMAMVRVVLTGLTTHGVGTVLFTLPEGTLPRLLGGFTVGGPVELPVVLQSLAEGYAIVALLGVFGVFNSVVSHHELLGAAPRAFHEAGLVVTIAAAFVPATVDSWRAVREADRARTGGIVRRRGRLARTVVPVLETGMERSLRLADSMDSRGFARHPPGGADAASAWGALAALLALAGAFVALVGRRSALAAGLAVAGGALLLGSLTLASRASPRQRYRPRRFTAEDGMVTLSAALGLTLVAMGAADGEATLHWSASPLHSPGLAALPTLGILLLAVPAALPTRAVAPAAA